MAAACAELLDILLKNWSASNACLDSKYGGKTEYSVLNWVIKLDVVFLLTGTWIVDVAVG
jgi:hypothetical protein